MRTSFPLSLVRPGATRSINMPGSFARIVITGTGCQNLLAGTVVVEKVFALPGLGDIFIKAVLNRDEPLILGIVAFLSILIMVFNLIVDISYGFLDPRIRYE